MQPLRRCRLLVVLGPLCVAALGACGSSGSSDAQGSSESTGGTSPTTTSAMTASATSSPSTTSSTPTTSTSSADSSTTEASGDTSSEGPPPEPAIHWVGRYDDSDPSRTRLGWSGAGFVARFDGTGVSVRMDDAAGYFTVVVDGSVGPVLGTGDGEQDYVLATGLPAGEHTVELYRRTEGSFGPTSIVSVDIEGELLAPPPVTRRIEVVGDSITCGYGNEGISPCSFSGATENHYQTYGAIAARTVGAEVSTVAWSGKGVVYNYGTDTNEPMPTLYERRLATEADGWGFEWQPDVVVVNLGTNDFSTEGDPTQELFVGTYTDFAAAIRARNPEAFILLVSPSLFGAEATMVDGYLAQVVANRNAAADDRIAWANINVEWIGSGCDGHPTVATHEGMAARLVEELGTHLGW
jgi:lysophospholipase L1-like esterase